MKHYVLLAEMEIFLQVPMSVRSAIEMSMLCQLVLCQKMTPRKDMVNEEYAQPAP